MQGFNFIFSLVPQLCYKQGLNALLDGELNQYISKGEKTEVAYQMQGSTLPSRYCITHFRKHLHNIQLI